MDGLFLERSKQKGFIANLLNDEQKQGQEQEQEQGQERGLERGRGRGQG